MFLSGGLAALAGGCSHSYIPNAASMLHQAFAGGDDLPLTRAEVDKIGYASLAVRMGRGTQALLILSGIDGDDLEWVSHEHELLVTRRGRVVRTYGLAQDVDHTEFVTVDPVEHAAALHEGPPVCVRTVDFGPDHEDGITIRSDFIAVGPDDLTILGETYRTNVWEEKSAAPDIGWEFTNAYWFDASSGYVWKSIQHTAPKIPPLEMIVFRRPTGVA